ncbi:MAG TPA: PQQ-binding-like beta-propeller repeat protein [Verrucomicrobiae bacterium]|nr:PQQ-binding-like beta-propeller repeat protein [Verrucomicrobiae bacterium]
MNLNACLGGSVVVKNSGTIPRTTGAHKLGRFTTTALGVVLLSWASGVEADEKNWPQFRGPHASGVTDGTSTPVSWNVETGENIRWRTEIPGLGHSSPIIWNDRVYVSTAVTPGKSELKVGLYGDIEPLEEKEKIQWRLMALEKKNGKVVWNTLGYEGVPRTKRHPKSTHCNSTPCTDGNSIVAIFGSEGLFCFDMEGKLAWRKDLGPMDSGFYLVPSAEWGFGSSPVIHGGKVIVLCDVLTNSFLAAFDLKDGTEIWRTPRHDVPTWGTPAIIEADGRTQIVVNGWHHIGGYEFDTGRERWRLDGGGDIPVPTPIFGNSLIYLTSAHGNSRPMRAIRPSAVGDITPKEVGSTNNAIAWAHARQGDYMQTPILVGDYLFGCLDSGVLTCFESHTGEIQFSERLGDGGQGFTASPVSCGGKLYFPSEVGKVYVVAATPKLSVLATNRLEETCMASPAISDGALFFRTREHLVAIGGKP